MWSEIAAIYRSSKKKQDINWFTEWIARPPAAIVVYALRDTPITPNQVTFAAAFVCAIAGAILVLLPGWPWLLVAAAVFEFSFVLDCVDGMLARQRKLASPLGHLLDFLMDELKAMLLLACVTVHIWRFGGGTGLSGYPNAPTGPGLGGAGLGDPWVLVIGLAAGFCLAAGLSLTSFTRRPEYGAKPPTEDGQPAIVGTRRGPIGLVLNAIEWAARIVVHYPQYFWLCAVVNRIDIYFWAYAAVNALYFAKTFAAICFRLGRFAAPTGDPR